MHTATVEGEIRKPDGRNANRRLRKRGMIPVIVYGHGEEPEMLALSHHDFALALEHGTHVVKVVIDGKQTQYLLKDVQYDHLQQAILHVDLMRVNVDESVRVNVALEFRGEPHGVHEGGDFITVMTDLDIECPFDAIPATLRVKVDHLGVGDTLHVGEIELPKGVVAHSKPDEVVATVSAKRGGSEADEEEAEAAEAAEAASAEPKVIPRGGQESESEG